MKQGSSLGWLAVLAVAFCGPLPAKAQSLGLGTGSRPQADSLQEYRNGSGEESAQPRRSQMNKRLGLTARRGGAFDPKVFEARGRELQNQFYEIGGPVEGGRESIGPGPAGQAGDASAGRKARRQWMLWVGVAGVAGASAGAVGYLLMSNSHPAAPPPNIITVKD